MSYHIRRIDPFWKAGPAVIALAIIGAAVAMFGYVRGMEKVAGAGAVLMVLGVVLATKPVLSCVLGCLGFFGGLVTFVLMPSANSVGMGLGLKVLSTALFCVLYMTLMDALILVVSVLYNVFGAGLGGIELEIDAAAGRTEMEG